MSLPNFMCIGAAKSGTTSLYDILKQHSDIFVPSFKEPHFFDIPSAYKNGISWYEKSYFSNVKNENCVGDFTPTYLFEEKTAQRIFNDLGKDVKFIVILRNPVDRAYSHYLHSKRDCHELLSFKEALVNEKTRFEKSVSIGDYLSKLRFSYIRQGSYAHMLKEYFKYFPKENFLILNFEKEFVAERKETIDKVLLFLNVNNEKIEIDLKSNIASKARFTWLKNIMNKQTWWNIVLKKMIPSVEFRRILRNRIQRANNVNFLFDEISDIEKKDLYNRYFKHEVLELEELLNKKMDWD